MGGGRSPPGSAHVPQMEPPDGRTVTHRHRAARSDGSPTPLDELGEEAARDEAGHHHSKVEVAGRHQKGDAGREQKLAAKSGHLKVEDKCPGATEYQVYGRRWIMLLILCFDIFVAYIPYYTFVPILPQSMRAYGASEVDLNMLCMVYPLACTPCLFLTGFSLQSHGCRRSFILAAGLLVAGCWIRWEGAAPHQGELWPVWWDLLVGPPALMPPPAMPTALPAAIGSLPRLLFGQVLCALGLPFFVNATSQMALDWFPPEERSVASMVSNLQNFLGACASFVVPTLFVGEELNADARQEWRQIQRLLSAQLVLSIAALLLTALVYQAHPPTPPAASAERHRGENVSESVSGFRVFMQELGRLVRLRDFWRVTMQFSLYLTALNAFDTVEGALLLAYGYNPAVASWTACSFTLSAVLSTAVEAKLMDNPTKYRRSIILMMVILSLSFLLMVVGFTQGLHVGFFVLAVGVMGFSTPGWGCSVELCCEVSFPVRESSVTSLLEGTANLVSVAGIVLAQRFIDMGRPAYSLCFLAATGVGSALCIGLAPADALPLRRHMLEQQLAGELDGTDPEAGACAAHLASSATWMNSAGSPRSDRDGDGLEMTQIKPAAAPFSKEED